MVLRRFAFGLLKKKDGDGQLPSQIIHFHIPKCGGTSINAYLDFIVHASRAMPLNFIKDYRERYAAANSADAETWMEAYNLARYNARLRSTYFWQVVHDHDWCILPGRDDAYRLTILREPIARLLSQIKDYRRASVQDLESSDAITRSVIEATKSMPLAALVQKLRDSSDGRLVFNNFMTKVLADAGRRMYPKEAGSDRDIAEYLLRSFDLVGTVENLGDFVSSLAQDLVLPPPTNVPKLNETASSTLIDELDDDLKAQLIELNQDDIALFELANSLSRRRKGYINYDISRFEQAFDHTRLPAPHIVGDEAVYDFNMNVIGFGFQGRDYPDDPRCAVWTGPAETSMLYVAVPANQEVKVFLDHADYRHPSHREGLVVKIDGKVIQHTFEECPGYRERISLRVKAPRPFVRLELIVPNPMTDQEAGLDSDDRRKKGLCLRRYGYQFS